MPDGSALNHLRYGTGHLLQMNLQHGGHTLDIAGWQRDALHREISRTQGALHQETRYDALGRITLRRATGDRELAFLFERRYLWDRQDQLVQQMFTEDGIGQPGPQCLQSRFGYDARGQLTHSIQPHLEERFHYDAAGNRTDSSSATVWHNLLQRLGGTRWGYDRFSRLHWRHNGPQGEEHRFSYDAEHRLTGVSFTGNPHYQRAEYRYDALGRRTQKILYSHHGEPETVTLHWNGLRMVGEQSSRRPEQATRYLYQENSWEPLARVDSIGESSEVYWYHTELNGLPTRMTDEHGNLVWQGEFSAWGETRSERTPQPLATPQNLRYQGQYLDRETGLHYNLFRYYDPQCGRYTQPDPVGLAGGINLYQYAPNPLTWVDPLGLTSCKAKINAEHVFHGEINKRGRAVGFHHRGSIGHEGKSRITEVTTMPNSLGVYRAKVEILDPNSGEWIAKGPQSTMFPDSWNRQQVMSEIRSAYSERTMITSSQWEGISSSGVKIGGYLDKSGNINTAYPIL